MDLFVDTSRKGISMALADNASGLNIETVDTAARGETASAILDNLLARANSTLDHIDRVLVTVGPGSFSGLRTGVAFCQGLCFSGKRKLYGVSTLQALECFGLGENVKAPDIAVVTRARPGYWYLRQTINGKAKESFIETEGVKELLKINKPKVIVTDEAASADESLQALFSEINAQSVLDSGKPLSMWSPLFDSVEPSLIQEANYIQPSYFEKLQK